MYENCKIYGPYRSKKDGRLRCVIIFPNKVKRTISYPKYIVEKYYNKELKENETVDHIDGNYLNNDIKNLRILDRKQHIFNDVIRNKNIIYRCDYCGKQFLIPGNKISQIFRKDRENTAHFCSKECRGKYNAKIQHKTINKIDGQSIKIEKFTFHSK